MHREHPAVTHDLTEAALRLPSEQRAIRRERVHRTGALLPFGPEDIEQPISQRFEKIVREQPHGLAVKTRSQQFTYAELDEIANAIAGAILANGGSAQDPVLLLLENGAHVIASMLGVIKSNKFYVPVDPAHPFPRVQFMVQDSAARLIVTNDRNSVLAEKLSDGKLSLINIDHLEPASSAPTVGANSDSLAYILYTSGSTGKPKGVVQNHRNVLHVIRWYTERAQITPFDRIALLRSFSVNGGTLHTFAALLNGAAVLPFDLKEEGIEQLGNWFRDQAITICGGLGATTFNHFTASLSDDERFTNLRWILFGGEPIFRRHVELCRKHFAPGCMVVNALGATEASNFSEFVVDEDAVLTGDVVPCGYPTADMEVLLLDEDGAEVSSDEVGEIAVKSRYIALGYWRNPELTRSKFLPRGDERLYLTGDLGRRGSDGCLFYVGRKDFQTKIRGYRIETADVEAALLDLENVCNAAVAVQEESTGEKRLIAYIVSKRQPAPGVTRLRRELRDRLPEYMIPAVFVILDRMPLTPHGKLDRKALPPPQRRRPDLDNPFVAPATPLEKRLSRIWGEVLYQDEVGAHDNFFELGGHSLAAMRVIAHIAKEFQFELPLRSFLEAPTVAETATIILNRHQRKPDDRELTVVLADLESMSEQQAQVLLRTAREHIDKTGLATFTEKKAGQ